MSRVMGGDAGMDEDLSVLVAADLRTCLGITVKHQLPLSLLFRLLRL
ncbi:MAG: hypothetical protein IPI76_11795 [Chloracidobacterium sp.]|nr:hypothetical protein [Chloracidobacterium sp.]